MNESDDRKETTERTDSQRSSQARPMTFEREEDFERHLEAAGHRPAVPEAVLDRFKRAAHQSWRESLEGGLENEQGPEDVPGLEIERRETADDGDKGEVPPRPSVRSGSAALATALAAAVVVALALGLWLSSGAGSGDRAPVADEASIARVVSVSGEPWMEWGLEGRDVRQIVVGTPLAAGAVIETHSTDLASLRLDEALSLRVAPDSRVELVESRVVRLHRGAVYVDTFGTTQAPSPAIEIRTPFGTARDVGTQFEVRLAPEVDAALTVRVREGQVELASDSGSESASAGEVLTSRSDGLVERSSIDPTDASWGWVLESAPPFELDGASLEEFLAWIVRETHWQVRFEDASVEARQGEIEMNGDSVELSVAPSYLPTVGLEGELEGAILVIRGR